MTILRPKKFLLPILIGALALLSGCRATDIKVREASADEMLVYGERFGDGGLSNSSGNILANYLLTDEKPETVIATLDHFRLADHNNPHILPALAEFCLVTGMNCSDKDLAARYFLTSMLYCGDYLTTYKNDEGSLYTQVKVKMIWTYNQALSHFYLYLKERNIVNDSSYQLTTLNDFVITFAPPKFDLILPPDEYKEFIPCASLAVENLRHVTYQFGYGCPLVAILVDRPAQKYLQPNTPSAATVILSFSDIENTEGHRRAKAELIYFDPDRNPEFARVDKYPLAADFSTPIAYRSVKPLEIGYLTYMLRPDKAAKQSGLYMLEPYDPEKIPVVLVHGLMSSILTWLQMINTLESDPAIRTRYQFFGYTYSSGNPLLLSAEQFRSSLLELREELKLRNEELSNFDQMVIIGHSMGGLLARCAVTDTADSFYRLMLESSREEVLGRLKPELREAFDNRVTFSHLPFVRRVIFLAVPHRGASMADSSIGNLANRLIQMPATFLQARDEMLTALAVYMSKFSIKGNPNGINNLSPKDPILSTLGKIPFAPNIPYHSIIGNRCKADTPGGSDGIVTYESAHLDGAASEVVVKSDHSVHEQPLAIHEVRRILLQHLAEIDGK